MRRRSAWLATLGVVAALGVLGSASPAHAQPDAAIEEAKRLFKAGARAYEAGKYRAAWQTFDQAFELTPRPELRFSAAQALRRLYTVEPSREYLERALRYYREYLAAVPQGGRRLDATTAAEEIEKLLGPGAAVVEPEPAVAPPPAPVTTPLATLIVDTPTAGARVALADEEPGEPPLVRDLPAGRYAVRITADGYLPIEREV
ncbi:MAG: PEGA domain-containing protein, partial [Polyangiaceae bacterium]|nr:PEGA domain-containing protein [Polyangiaceae bacterium]